MENRPGPQIHRILPKYNKDIVATFQAVSQDDHMYKLLLQLKLITRNKKIKGIPF